MKKRKDKNEIAEEFKGKLLANPEYLRSLDEAVEIILEGEKGGRWKTLEEIEEARERRKPTSL